MNWKIALSLLCILYFISPAKAFSHFDYEVEKTVQLPSHADIEIPIYKSSGDKGPSILFVHGNSSSSRAFYKQYFSFFGKKHKLFFMDLPGHGLASKVDASRELPRQENGLPLGFSEYQTGLVEALATVANDPDVQADVIVGWSLGGDVMLLAQGLGLLPNVKGLMMFGTAPNGANAPSGVTPFLPNYIPGVPGLSVLPSFGFSFQADPSSSLGFNLLGSLDDPVPPYAAPPTTYAPNRGEAYLRSFFGTLRRYLALVPSFMREDAFDRSDDRFRSSLGVIALGLLPPGPVPLPDEIDVLEGLQGDPQDPTDDIPLAVLVGKQESLVNADYLKALKADGRLPTLWKDRVIEVPWAGHAIQMERPLYFNRLLKDFVKSL